ncbi:MAG: hypothetical protein ACLFUA_06400 [Spirochaetales bacterium]
MRLGRTALAAVAAIAALVATPCAGALEWWPRPTTLGLLYGFGFERNYYALIPERETRWYTGTGYRFRLEGAYHDLVARSRLRQSILGDRLHTDVTLDLVAESGLVLRLAASGDPASRAEVALGAVVRWGGTPPIELAGLVAEARVSAEIAGTTTDLAAGSAPIGALRAEASASASYPIAGRFLVAGIALNASCLDADSRGGYPAVFLPSLSALRAFSHEDRGPLVAGARFVLASRLFEFDVYYPMALGFTAFAELGSDEPTRTTPVPAIGGGVEFHVVQPWVDYALRCELAVARRLDATGPRDPIVALVLEVVDLGR